MSHNDNDNNDDDDDDDDDDNNDDNDDGNNDSLIVVATMLFGFRTITSQSRTLCPRNNSQQSLTARYN